MFSYRLILSLLFQLKAFRLEDSLVRRAHSILILNFEDDMLTRVNESSYLLFLPSMFDSSLVVLAGQALLVVLGIIGGLWLSLLYRAC